MPPAANHTSPYHEEEIQLSIQMHQADQFIATAKLITRVGAIDLLAPPFKTWELYGGRRWDRKAKKVTKKNEVIRSFLYDIFHSFLIHGS